MYNGSTRTDKSAPLSVVDSDDEATSELRRLHNRWYAHYLEMGYSSTQSSQFAWSRSLRESAVGDRDG